MSERTWRFAAKPSIATDKYTHRAMFIGVAARFHGGAPPVDPPPDRLKSLASRGCDNVRRPFGPTPATRAATQDKLAGSWQFKREQFNEESDALRGSDCFGLHSAGSHDAARRGGLV